LGWLRYCIRSGAPALKSWLKRQ